MNKNGYVLLFLFAMNLFSPDLIMRVLGEPQIYFLSEEMKRRMSFLPVKGIKPPTDKTKEMRILSLVPHFEWGRVYLNKNLNAIQKGGFCIFD